jgi:hypothetical protein
MNDSAFEEKCFEDMLNRVLLDIEAEQIEAVAALFPGIDDSPVFKTSLWHKLQMKIILRRFQRKNSWRAYPVRRPLGSVIASIAAVFSIGVYVGAEFFGLFQQSSIRRDEYDNTSLVEEYAKIIAVETAFWPHGQVYVPYFVPEGYTFDQITVTDNCIEIRHLSSSDNYLQFSMAPLKDNELWASDQDELNAKIVSVKECEAIYITKDSMNSLRYISDEYIFEITSDTLAEEELLLVGENIEAFENLIKYNTDEMSDYIPTGVD